MTPELMEEIQEQEDEAAAESQEDTFSTNQELQEAYGYPEGDEKQNQHSFLHKAAFGGADTIKTTYLNEYELGRPLFSMRFLLDMEDVAMHYLDEFAKKCESLNKISKYFKMKAYNVADSGMSNEGFAMNLNVMRKMEMVRKKLRDPLQNLKGGKKRKI